MILHIPHSATDTKGVTFDCDLEQELHRMTDWFTDKLFEHTEATRIVLPVSRLICDVERFEDDNLEVMAAKGMGVCYTTNSFGEKLRDVNATERAYILETYYKPHHEALTTAVDEELEHNGSALMIDCHSFSNTPLPHEGAQETPRPDICIGTDTFHTPQVYIDIIQDHFTKRGYNVAINTPFAGTLIPMKHYQCNARVHSVMIELNRDLYMGNGNFNKVKDDVTELLTKLSSKLLK